MADTLLAEFLLQRCALKFEYGVSDCAIFVIEWLDLALGQNAISHFKGLYHDKESCAAVILEMGGFLAFAEKFIKIHYGLKPASPSRGNVVLVQIDKHEVLAIRLSDVCVVVLKYGSGVFITHNFTIIQEWGLI